jgi:hypothetical protein
MLALKPYLFVIVAMVVNLYSAGQNESSTMYFIGHPAETH